MFRINLPFSDGYVLLMPRIGGLPRIAQVGIFALALGLLLYLIVRLYRYELHFIPKMYSRGLLGLRLLIVALILIAAGLKPNLRFVSREEIPSHLLVAIDLSDSMNITDPQRDPLEKLEIARALKVAADLADDKTIANWMDQLRKVERPNDPAYLQVVERVDQLTRKALAARVLTADGIGLLKILSEQHKLQVVGFDQQLGPLSDTDESIRSILRGGGKRTSEAFTDLNLPLKRGMDLRDELKEGLVGIVVLSDGQHNWGGIPGELAYQLGHTETKAPIPVHAIVFGAKIPPPDFGITSVKASPPNIFKHASANLDIRLQANNLPEGKFKITVTYPEAPDLPDRKPVVEFIDYDGINQPAPKSIPVKMDRAASERLTVSVELIAKDGSRTADRFPENNSRQVVINVAPGKAKVLLVDGESRWEQYYLQTALQRDETMETKSVVFDQPRLNVVRNEDLPSLKLPDLKLPGPDDLPRHDCIILGDVSPEQLPFDERNRLEKYVADRGGTLVILAGKRSMPLEFLEAGDPIARMLPITNPRLVDRKDGFKVALTSEGMQTGFMRLEADAPASDERWAGLPPHFWAIVGKAKEGAVALAFSQASDRKLNPDQERANALIVRHNYGFGRVIYVGLDSTWRWRFKQGDKYHHRFWSQLIRWAASDRALIAGNDFIRFGVREPVYRGDQEIEMIARAGAKSKSLDKNTLVGARLFRKTNENDAEDAVGLMSLKANPEVPGQYEGARGQLPPGDYAMELALPGFDDNLVGPDGKKLRAAFKVLPPDSGEMLNLATNWERMKEIADKSGGTMVAAEKAADLIEKLKARTATREIATDKHLWESWWLLAPLLALLTAEWLLRKRAGLA